jgi:UDP-N-acetylmuramate-alanine ligase
MILHGGIGPATVIGGKVHAMGTNAARQSDLLVAEADESDGRS